MLKAFAFGCFIAWGGLLGRALDRLSDAPQRSGRPLSRKARQGLICLALGGLTGIGGLTFNWLLVPAAALMGWGAYYLQNIEEFQAPTPQQQESRRKGWLYLAISAVFGTVGVVVVVREFHTL